MHDTHLIEKIYGSIVDLCRQYSITRVNEIWMEVDEDSHIDAQHLLSHLKERDSSLIGDWTVIHVNRQPFEQLTAVIKRIDGNGFE